MYYVSTLPSPAADAIHASTAGTDTVQGAPGCGWSCHQNLARICPLMTMYSTVLRSTLWPGQVSLSPVDGPNLTAYRAQSQSQSQSQSQAPCFLRHTLFLPAWVHGNRVWTVWLPVVSTAKSPPTVCAMSGAGFLDCLVLYTQVAPRMLQPGGTVTCPCPCNCSSLFSLSLSLALWPALFLLRSSGGGRCCCHTHPCLACLVSFRLSR